MGNQQEWETYKISIKQAISILSGSILNMERTNYQYCVYNYMKLKNGLFACFDGQQKCFGMARIVHNYSNTQLFLIVFEFVQC